MTDEGLVGIGEASQSGDDRKIVEFIQKAWLEVLAAATVDEPLELKVPLRDCIEPAQGNLPRQTAYSSLEQCLWDIQGQLSGRPLHQLLGGGALRERVLLYANINRGAKDRSPQGMATVARSAVARGFSALKCAPFDELKPSQPRTQAWRALEYGIDRVAAIRQQVGEHVDLMVDCQRRCSAQWVVEVGRRLSELGVTWLEDPLPPFEDAQLGGVVSAVEQRIALGEHFHDWTAFGPYRQFGEAVVFMPDVKHAGGIGGVWEIVQKATECGVPVSFHNPSGPIATAANLHIAACVPHALPLEFAWRETPHRSKFIYPEEAVDQGSLRVPSAPGLGVRANEDYLLHRSQVVCHQRAT